MADALHNNNNPGSSNTNSDASEIRYCDVSNLNVAKISWSHHLRTNLHKQLSGAQISDNLRCKRSAFRNRIETYIITNPNKECLDINLFQQSNKEQVITLLQEAQKKHIKIKFNFEQFCNYVLIKESKNQCEINLKSFQTKMQALNPTTSQTESLNEIINNLNCCLIVVER